MPEEFRDELFSAYLDDEAAAAERDAVELRLAASAEARQVLAEMSALSRELRVLPRAQCPADFAVRVLRAVDAGRMEVASSRTPGGTRRAGLLRNGAALASTALALLLAWITCDPQFPTPRNTGELQREASRAAATNVAAHLETALPRGDKRNQSLAKHLARDDRDPSPELGGRNPHDPLVPPIVFGARNAPGRNSAQGLVFVDDLKALSGEDVGRVLTAIEHSPRGISVVKLTVVDCRKGLDELELLLSRNRIHSPPGVMADKDVKLKDESSPGASRLVAVYVQSTSDRLASVMSDLKSKSQFRRLQVDPPISPQRLDPRTQFQIAMLDPQTAGEAASSVGAGRAVRPPESRIESRSSDSHPGSGSRPIPPGARSVAELDRISRQLSLTIPAELLAPSEVESPGTRAGDPIRSLTGAVGSQTAGVGRSVRRPLRVLFVLVCPPALSAPRKRGP